MDLVLLGEGLFQLGDIEAGRTRHFQDHRLLPRQQIAGRGDLGGDGRGDRHRTVPVRVHEIARGDTLFGMSLRYGVSLSLIQEFNPSVNPHALRLGGRVLIPQLPRSQEK